jgi:uncharacterized protein YbcI
MGLGSKDIHAHLIGDLLVVRLRGVLTAAEQQLVKTLPSEKGRDLLKPVRTQIIEAARPVMEAMVQEVTGAKVRHRHRHQRRGRALRPVRAAPGPRYQKEMGPAELG